MNIGIIGTGSMGRTHAAAFAKTPAHIAGFVTRSGRSALADEYGVPAFATLQEMLPHVDVVDICTPTPQHLEQACAASAAGKHVICEKPLARTVADAEAIAAACEAAGVRLLVAQVLRYFPDYAHAHDEVARGALGDVRELRLLRAGHLPSKAHENWFVDLDASGGPLFDLLIHDYDFARWVAGEVTDVQTRSTGGADAHVFVTLRHASGAVTHIEGGWHLGPGEFRTALEVIGTRGTLRASSSDRPYAATPSSQTPAFDPYELQAQEFYAALADGAPVRVTPRDGVEAVRIAAAAAGAVM
ncbi:MAG: Gfo/Idh/MocA family oxidoreductase [Chloroflexi bacterium]|nr:Gfo/Idh/MocA family oxidoreductase [Chloroflexota bacterium]